MACVIRLTRATAFGWVSSAALLEALSIPLPPKIVGRTAKQISLPRPQETSGLAHPRCTRQARNRSRQSRLIPPGGCWLVGGTERFYGAGGEEMATSSLYLTDGVPRCPSRTT